MRPAARAPEKRRSRARDRRRTDPGLRPRRSGELRFNSGTPNHARAGPLWRFCLSTPLHAPRSPSSYTAVDVCSSYVSYRSTCVGAEFVPVSCRDVQHHMRWYKLYIQCWDFHFLRFSAIPRSWRSVPGRTLHAPRSPSWSSSPVLSPGPQRADVSGGRGATARPREAKGSSGVAAVSWVSYNKNIFSKIYLDITANVLNGRGM